MIFHKNRFAIIFFLTGMILFQVSIFPQWEFRSSMGINFVKNNELSSYINKYYAASYNKLSDYNAAIEFALEAGYLIAQYQVGIEAAFEKNSFNFSTSIGNYVFDYSSTSITPLFYFVVLGSGFKLKAGGGVGLRFFSADETKPPLNSAVNYQSTGYGFLLKADGSTMLGGNFFAYICGDLRYNFYGIPKNNGIELKKNSFGETLNLSSFSAGIKIGISYFI